MAYVVTDYDPSTAGPAEVAGHLQEWFGGRAVAGVRILSGVYDDRVNAFVDDVISILQARGLFQKRYEDETLCDHIGAPPKYGHEPCIIY